MRKDTHEPVIDREKTYINPAIGGMLNYIICYAEFAIVNSHSNPIWAIYILDNNKKEQANK